MTPTGDQLVREIRDAFPVDPVPAAASIVPETVPRDAEREEIRAAFGGRRWSDLPTGVLRYHSDALFLLSGTGYRYYLPAYMRLSVEEYEDADIVPFSLVRSLTTPRPSSGDQPWFQERMDGLTQAQRDVIRRFLHHLEAHRSGSFTRGEIHAALRSF